MECVNERCDDLDDEFEGLDQICVVGNGVVDMESSKCIDPIEVIKIGDKYVKLLVDSGARTTISLDMFENNWKG